MTDKAEVVTRSSNQAILNTIKSIGSRGPKAHQVLKPILDS